MLDAVVAEAAERWGDATWVVAPAGWPVTFAELHRASDEVAVGLLAAGIGEGDVVGLALPTSPDHLVAYAACAKVGAITAGINPRLTQHERTVLLAKVAPRLVIEADVGGTSPATMLEPLRQQGQAPPPLTPDPDRPVAVVFTSGTTGLPRGAIFSGRQLAFITSVDTGGRWGDGGPSLGATSLAHLGPTTKFAGNLMKGGTTYLVERWCAADALGFTAEHTMAVVAGIPTQLALMLHHPTFESTDLSSVRATVAPKPGSGSAPGSPTLRRTPRCQWGARTGGWRFRCAT